MFTQTEVTKKGIKLEIPEEDKAYSHLLIAYLKSVNFSAKALPISYRILNHWETMGLVKSIKRDSAQWRKIGFFETVWIYILSELRLYGYSLEKALTVRQDIFGEPISNKMTTDEIDHNLQLQFMFELECVRALLKKQIIYAIHKSGTITPIYSNDLSVLNVSDSVLLVSLNSIIEKLFIDCKMDPSYSPDLTREERNIILLLRENQYKEIKITYKGRRPHIFYGEQILESRKKIAELMKEHLYQDITITTINGKVGNLKRTIKRKISD